MAGLAAVALVPAGCSEPADSVELTESELIEGAWANPVDRVIYPDESAANLIQEAGEAAITQCMAERGYEYQGGAFPWAFVREQAQYVYGVTDPDSARANGVRSALWMASVHQLEHEFPSPDEGYTAALNGAATVDVRDSDGAVVGSYDPDSCLGAALDSVTPNWADMDGLREKAYQLLLVASEVEDGSAVRDGYAAWSECMAAAGYDYPDPWSMAEAFPGDSPTETEKAAAVASANCKHSSGLLRAWSKARAEATWEELRRSEPDLLSRWDALLAETVKHVEGLGGAG